MSHISRVIDDFFVTMVTMVNRGLAGLNFNDTINLPYLENPLVGATISTLSLILAEL